MKNSDTPAYPQSNPEIVKAFLEVEQESPNGLTKREAFAMAAMQGILANRQYEPPRRNRIEGMAEDAVYAADALLAELEKWNTRYIND